MHARLRRPAVALITTALAASVLGAAPAAHAADGAVSGVVTGPSGPVDDVEVELYRYDADGGYWDYAYGAYDYTDETGAYSIPVTPGEYRVGFLDGSGRHAEEFFDDAARFEDAEVVTVPSGGTVVASAELTPAAHVTGAVTGPNGIRLGDIRVTAFEAVVDGDDVDYERVASDWTDAEGLYDIDGLRAGTYRIEFNDGYAAGFNTYATEYYNDRASVFTADDVTVAAEATVSGIDAELGPDAEFSGRVVDSSGAGIGNAWVEVLVKAGDGWKHTGYTRTAVDGSYVLDGLRAGTYRVEFSSMIDDAWVSEFWNDAATVEDADDVVLALGAERAGIDATLVPGEHDPEMLPYFESTSAPVVSGAAQVGSTLTASPGTWNPAPSMVEYFWYRDGEWIDGAFSATYVPTAADLGKQLTVQTVANGEGYERSYSDVSAPTAPVVAAPVVTPPAPVVTPPAPVVTPPAPVVAPVPAISAPTALAAILEGVDVAGKPKVGKTLKLSGLDKLFRASTPVSYSFTWFAGKKAIKKATKSKLKVTKAMKGKKISVKVTAKAASTTRSVKLKVGKVR